MFRENVMQLMKQELEYKNTSKKKLSSMWLKDKRKF